MIEVDEYEYDNDDWKYEDLYREQDEPDYYCWTCQDSGSVQGAKREVNCPDCRPTPRQQRRRDRRDAWRQRRWHRRLEREGPAGLNAFDTEAPF